MTGATVLVTGATSGIGLAAATALAATGATTVLVARDHDRVAATVRHITAATGNPQVSGLVADLSQQAQIHDLGVQFSNRYERLDVLVNNAGAGFAHHQLSADGIEMTWALNHLAPFLLTHLLLSHLRRAHQGRVITVASSSHRGARLSLGDINDPARYGANGAYSRSKLANLLFTYALARRLGADPDNRVTANATDPGPVATNLFRSPTMANATDPALRLGMLIHRLVGRPPLHAARGIAHLATHPDLDTISGTYWKGRRQISSSRSSRDTTLQDELWDHSLHATGLPTNAADGSQTTISDDDAGSTTVAFGGRRHDGDGNG